MNAIVERSMANKSGLLTLFNVFSSCSCPIVSSVVDVSSSLSCSDDDDVDVNNNNVDNC